MKTKIRIIIVLLFLFIPVFSTITLQNFLPESFLEIRYPVKVEKPNQINMQSIKNLRLYIDYKNNKFLSAFKAACIQLKNYIYLYIAPYRINDAYIWSDIYGYYPVDTVKRYFKDVNNLSASNEVISELESIQELLAKKNIKFVVVKAPAKIQLLPGGIKNIFYEIENTDNKKAFNNEKKDFFIDFEKIHKKIFLEPDQVFSKLGFHWNHYASCFFSNEILLQINNQSQINCENFELKKAYMTDIDIFMMHPFFNINSFLPELKYPKLSMNTITELPKIAIIGDSFVDQIIYNLINSTKPGNVKNITFYDYFSVRKKINIDGSYNRSDIVRDTNFLKEIESNQVIVLVLSDGNYPRTLHTGSFYGFHTYLRENYAF